MNDTWVTIVGNVVEDPRARETKNGHKVTNFRVASTSRRYDREQERYVDNETLYVTVTCWRAQAVNVAESLRRGHPVVVYGRYYTRDYRVDDQVRTSYELEATAVGHDLSRGVSSFKRMNRTAPPAIVAVDAQGIPADESHRWLDLAEPVDPQTGEIPGSEGAGGVASPGQPAAAEQGGPRSELEAV
ncbi:MAG TPA: single-stranded DNA-binding protein [Jatrophihabitans sp.]|nr:single-stranded DNA-binding protein [Jatrophihabitans sp.]